VALAEAGRGLDRHVEPRLTGGERIDQGGDVLGDDVGDRHLHLPALSGAVVHRATGLLGQRQEAPAGAVDDEQLELIRGEARHRRGRNETESAPVLAGELEIRPDRFQAFVSGESLDLTRREFELLHLLAGTQGQVLERETIYQRVWGYAMAHGDRSVDVFIRKLRQKLEKRSPEWEYIHTHFGVGYRFDPEPSSDAAATAQPIRSKEASNDQSSQVVHKSFTAA